MTVRQDDFSNFPGSPEYSVPLDDQNYTVGAMNRYGASITLPDLTAYE